MEDIVYSVPTDWLVSLNDDVVNPERQDSLWYHRNPLIEVWTPTKEVGYVGVYGEVRLLLGEAVTDISELDRSGIDTDQKLYELVEQDKLEINMNNWFECRSIYDEEYEDCVHESPHEAFIHLLEVMDRDYTLELQQEKELWEA